MMKESLFKKVMRHIRCKFVPETQVQMYKRLGITIGDNCDIINSSIDCLLPEIIHIGDNVTITHASILAHDASTKRSLGYTKFGRVIIGNNVFVGWGSIVLPNVIIGDNCIIGAGSVVNKDVPSNSVAVGNPAKVVCTFEEYIRTHSERIKESYVCDDYPNLIKQKRRKILIDSIMSNGGGMRNSHFLEFSA